MAAIETGEPVAGFPIVFQWTTGPWLKIFDAHIELVRRDLRRAQAEDRVIVYLSCPISSRGGGHFRTNVDIANFTVRRLLDEWGERFFILNPAAYQLESKEGTGLIMKHIEELFPNEDPAQFLATLLAEYKPQGGDYMRMWTKVLVDDAFLKSQARRGKNCGGLFDAFYFLGPTDVRRFFDQSGGVSLTAAIEEFFARKHALDADFRQDFDFLLDGNGRPLRPLDLLAASEADQWQARRKSFFRYYSLRGSAAYSLGSHDEWNIFKRINERRVQQAEYGPGEQIAGYFDGRQIDMGAAESGVSKGYESAPQPHAGSPHPGEVSWPTGAKPAT